MTGTEAGDLVRCGHSVADVTAGMFALIGVLMALRTRDQTRRGQQVDVAMLDGMISAMASSFANLFGSGVSPIPRGTAFGTIVPYACFPTQDRSIGIAVASEKLWQAFGPALGRPDLTDDPRFRTNALRIENRSVLESLITEIFRRRPAAEWLEILDRHGVPCTLVNTLAEVAADPQPAERDMFPTVDHPVAGPTKVTGAPIKFSETSGRVGSPPHSIGNTPATSFMNSSAGLAPTSTGLSNRGSWRADAATRLGETPHFIGRQQPPGPLGQSA